MVRNPVHLSGVGPVDQQLPSVDAHWQDKLSTALAVPEHQRRSALSAVRVGYHRGLDALRANGWRGAGYVRWTYPSDRGFLNCLRGLGASARRIGEIDEAERCKQFLLQLDPSGFSNG